MTLLCRFNWPGLSCRYAPCPATVFWPVADVLAKLPPRSVITWPPASPVTLASPPPSSVETLLAECHARVRAVLPTAVPLPRHPLLDTRWTPSYYLWLCYSAQVPTGVDLAALASDLASVLQLTIHRGTCNLWVWPHAGLPPASKTPAVTWVKFKGKHKKPKTEWAVRECKFQKLEKDIAAALLLHTARSLPALAAVRPRLEACLHKDTMVWFFSAAFLKDAVQQGFLPPLAAEDEDGLADAPVPSHASAVSNAASRSSTANTPLDLPSYIACCYACDNDKPLQALSKWAACVPHGQAIVEYALERFLERL